MLESQVSLLYVTTSSLAEAKKIAQALLKKRLIACANILPGMKSIYCWEDKMESADEVVVILKTSKAKVVAVEKMVKSLHSYQVPCVIELRAGRVSDSYLSWLMGEIE